MLLQCKISDEGNLQHGQHEFLRKGIEHRTERNLKSVVLGSFFDTLAPSLPEKRPFDLLVEGLSVCMAETYVARVRFKLNTPVPQSV